MVGDVSSNMGLHICFVPSRAHSGSRSHREQGDRSARNIKHSGESNTKQNDIVWSEGGPKFGTQNGFQIVETHLWHSVRFLHIQGYFWALALAPKIGSKMGTYFRKKKNKFFHTHTHPKKRSNRFSFGSGTWRTLATACRRLCTSTLTRHPSHIILVVKKV